MGRAKGNYHPQQITDTPEVGTLNVSSQASAEEGFRPKGEGETQADGQNIG